MRRIRMIFISSLLFLIGAPTLMGQPNTFDHLTIEQGLSNNTVYAIAQDEDGFLWFGTRDGLNRYDGYEFKIFESEAPGGLASNHIRALLCLKNGDLLIGLKTGGLFLFDQKTQRIKEAPIQDSLSIRWKTVSIESIFQSKDGEIWLGTYGQGVFHLNADYQLLHHFHPDASPTRHQLASNHCFSFCEDDQGRIWMGTSEDVVHFYVPQEDAIGKVIGRNGSENDLYSFTKSLLFHQGIVWVGTEGKGLHLIDPDSLTFKAHYLDDLLIKDIALDKKKEIIYLSTDGNGLFWGATSERNFKNNLFSPTLANGLNSNALYDIYIDERSNIWIGSFNGGVNVHKPRKAPFLNYIQSTKGVIAPANQSVLSFLEDSQGNIWIGRDGAGLQKIPAKKNRPVKEFSQQNGLSSKVIKSIFEDSKGNLWIGTFAQGVNRFDIQRNENVVFQHDPEDPNSISNNNVWAILEGPNKNIWLGTLGGGLNQYDPTSNTFKAYLPDPNDSTSISDRNITCLLLDTKGQLWIGTEFGGLNRLSPGNTGFDRWQVHSAPTNGLQSNNILCLHQDSQNRIWVGTEGGGLHLLKEDERTFQQFGTEDGFSSNVINAIEEASDGKLWLSTNEGLIAFSPENGHVQNYDTYDGLQSTQFNPNASLLTQDGFIYFGGISGWNVFNPLEVEVNNNLPNVVFTEFLLFNQSVEISTEERSNILSGPLNDSARIHLHYYDNIFTIGFAAIEYTNPQGNQYAYRMVGFDETWNYVDASRRRATYTNLNPGTYEFEVKASNNNNQWTTQPKVLQIIIQPPFWKTWWFRTMIAFAFVGLFYGYLSFVNRRRIETHQRELLKAEQEILKLKNQQLNQEVDEKNARLSAALLQTAHKNSSLNELKNQLVQLSEEQQLVPGQKKEFRNLVRRIDQEMTSEDYWQQFQLNFDQVHQQFSKRLLEWHPQLTTNDVRLCCLLRINMTNREIASIQTISIGAVEKSKYRLKKKLGLPKNEDLTQYILQLS